MIRKLTILAAALTLLFTFAVVQDSEAQCVPGEYNEVTGETSTCVGTARGYPRNGFTPNATPTPRPTPQPTSSAVASADNVEATATSGGSGAASIAFTGSESRVLGYAGAGLIGFGAIALIAARRKGESDLD